MLRKISAIGFLFTGPRLPGVDTKPCWLTPKSSLFQEVAFLWNFYTLFPAWIKSSNCIPDKMTWSNIWIPRDYHGGARVESDTSLYRVTVTSFKTCKSHIMQTQRRNWIRSLVGVGIDLFQYFAIIFAQRLCWKCTVSLLFFFLLINTERETSYLKACVPLRYYRLAPSHDCHWWYGHGVFKKTDVRKMFMVHHLSVHFWSIAQVFLSSHHVKDGDELLFGVIDENYSWLSH